MSRPRDKISTKCPNIDCKFFLLEKGKDIVKCGRNRAGNQQYYCKHCGKWFVETASTLFYRRHMPKSDLVEICKLIIEKKGIRSIERITGHHRDTISRLLFEMAFHVDEVDKMLEEAGLNLQELKEFRRIISARSKKNMISRNKNSQGPRSA